MNIEDIVYKSYKEQQMRENCKEREKWRLVFEYLYMLWEEGIKTQFIDRFFKGMKVPEFRELWRDKEIIVDNLYSQLCDYKKEFYY